MHVPGACGGGEWGRVAGRARVFVHGKRGAWAKGDQKMNEPCPPDSRVGAGAGVHGGPVATDLRVLNGSPEPAEARLPRCRHCHVGPATHELRTLDPATGRLRILDLCPACHSVMSERMHPTTRAERRRAQRAAKRARRGSWL